MFGKICALAAVVALSLSSVACVAAAANDDDANVEDSSSDLVSRSASFETFQGLDNHYYFNLVAANGQDVLRSQSYTALASAQNGVSSVLDNGNDKRNFDVLQAMNGDWYFNLKAANGEVIGTSELYASQSNAERGARTVRALVRVQIEATRDALRREQFELFTGEDGKAYFHLRAGNGEILLSSQAYTAKSSAKTGIASVKTNGVDASSFEVSETWNGGWGVHLVAANGEVIARSETYSSKSNATRAVDRMVEILSGTVKTAE